MFKVFKAINNFFSTKHDLLAIGLFIGAAIALMLSELFNWFLSNQIVKAVPVNGFWFAFISFLILILKLVCVAYLLFGIERLYNRFVRKPFIQRTKNLVEQEAVVSAALEETTSFGVKTVDAVQLSDVDSVSTSDQSENKEGFIVEYLQGHDTGSYKIESQQYLLDDLQSFKQLQVEPAMYGFKYRDELQGQPAALTEEDKPVSQLFSEDLIAILKQDLQKQLSSKSTDGQIKEDKIRNILAKNTKEI